MLCALVIMVPRDTQGWGMGAAAVRAMDGIARRHGLESLIAAVRPSWKARYPLVPIGRYAGWRRPDGRLFDPWMRVHERLGAAVMKPEPLSLRITDGPRPQLGGTTHVAPDTGREDPESIEPEARRAVNTAMSEIDALLLAPPFRLDSHGGQRQRAHSLGQVLDWPASQPGATWQERWAASGAEDAAGWREAAAAWLTAAGRFCPSDRQSRGLGAGLLLLI